FYHLKICAGNGSFIYNRTRVHFNEASIILYTYIETFLEREELLMENVQVLVIDDSAFMRKVISQLLSEDPRIQVIATARNGEDGLKKIEQFQPDVVTLDVEMPIKDGISTLKHIMNQYPTPVVMVSSMTAKGAESTVKAIQLGAIDFIQKPSGPISLDMDHIQENMIETVIAASKANVKEKKVKKIKV